MSRVGGTVFPAVAWRERLPEEAFSPVLAYGWRAGGETVWYSASGAPVAGQPLPPLTLRRLRQRCGRNVLVVTRLGPGYQVALLYGPGGYPVPFGQRVVLAAIWQGRLRFRSGDAGASVPAAAEPVLALRVDTAADVRSARRALQAYLAEAGISGTPAMQVAVAATEAMVNAVRHGDGGWVRVWHGGSRLQVAVRDEGPGLRFEELARALLAPRSGDGGHGDHGFWLMLTYALRCSVVTGHAGTRVLLAFDLTGGHDPGRELARRKEVRS